VSVLTATLTSADEQRRANDRRLLALCASVLVSAAFLGVITMSTAPAPFPVALTMLLMAALIVAIKPVAGIYLSVFFLLVTDAAISPAYPFGKNMSSGESMLFIANSIFVSPFEVILAITVITLILRRLIDLPTVRIVRGGLFWPLMVFTGFLCIGFVYGLATGGDRWVAVWEFRPILYLPIFYVLITNLFTTRRQYHRLSVVALLALVTHSVLALQALSKMSGEERDSLESLLGHQSAVQMNLVIAGAIAAWMLPKIGLGPRLLLLFAAIPVGWAYLVSERRAAVIGLAVAVIYLGVLMARLNPRRLRYVAPVFVLFMVGYLGAFWQSESTIGFPAQAIKSVIAPDDVSEKDQSSSYYREIENLDVNATIKAKPLTGLGFGQKFLRPIPLPDISFFVFYEYIPHNTILWIWIKAGIGGFIAMLFLIGASVRAGARAALRMTDNRDVLLAYLAGSFILMYTVFAYVDIAWDGRSLLVLAASMAVCSEFVRLPAQRPVTPDDGGGGKRRDRRALLHVVRQPEPARVVETVVPSRAA
jgi:O-Antigen ligase